jgi:hypothetical protein
MAITVVTQASQGTAIASVQNIAYHPDAFTLASVPFAEVPAGQGVQTKMMDFDGLAVNVTSGFDILHNRFIIRFDFMYGVKAIDPELACRFQS